MKCLYRRGQILTDEERSALEQRFRDLNREAQRAYRALVYDRRLRAAAADERVLPDRVTQHTN